MNLSLIDRGDHENFGGTLDTLQDEIDEHQDIMSGNNFTLTGRTALVTEGSDYPGSYQVWSETEQPGDERWIFVDPEGVVWYRACPVGCE